MYTQVGGLSTEKSGILWRNGIEKTSRENGAYIASFSGPVFLMPDMARGRRVGSGVDDHGDQLHVAAGTVGNGMTGSCRTYGDISGGNDLCFTIIAVGSLTL